MQTTTLGPLLYRPEEAAQTLRCSRRTVFDLIASGRLRSVKIGRLRRIPHDALEELIEQLGQQA